MPSIKPGSKWVSMKEPMGKARSRWAKGAMDTAFEFRKLRKRAKVGTTELKDKDKPV